jgi:hypothetical protein
MFPAPFQAARSEWEDLVTRKIVHRTRGYGHSPIVRLMSPSDLGEHLKPFVFLDLFEADMRGLAGSMPVHPHSGIATVTVFTEGDVTFDDPHAGHGTIGYGGVEWVRALNRIRCGDMPALQALDDGYDVFVVTDASGGVSAEAHDMGVRRMVAAGAVPMTWLAVLGEWQRDWARENTAAAVAGVVAEHGGASGVAVAWEMQLLAARVGAGV